jgi:hypothetical protein
MFAELKNKDAENLAKRKIECLDFESHQANIILKAAVRYILTPPRPIFRSF